MELRKGQKLNIDVESRKLRSQMKKSGKKIQGIIDTGDKKLKFTVDY